MLVALLLDALDEHAIPLGYINPEHLRALSYVIMRESGSTIMIFLGSERRRVLTLSDLCNLNFDILTSEVQKKILAILRERFEPKPLFVVSWEVHAELARDFFFLFLLVIA